MSLEPGAKLGSYEILSAIGAGGMDEGESTRLGNARGARAPFFSPDGEWVCFFAGTRLKKVPRTGGGAFDLAEATNLTAGAF